MLANKHRPSTLKNFLGQQSTIQAFKSKINLDNPPNVYLITGPSGCGKTTLARIAIKHFNVSVFDSTELDSADFRGIDIIRKIKDTLPLAPMQGKRKAYIFDECFHENTRIRTPSGNVKIKNIKAGDKIYSAFGIDTVSDTFINNIPLDRIIMLKIGDKKIYTTKDHLFYTNKGWVKAVDLNKDHLIYSFIYDKNIVCKSMSNINKQGAVYEDKKTMSLLQKIYSLLSKSSREIQQKILFTKLRSKTQNTTTRNKKSIIQRSNKKKNIRSPKEISQNRIWKNFSKKTLRKNEEKKSHAFDKKHKKNESHEKDKRHFKCLEWGKRWKWKINQTTKNIIFFIRVAYGSFSFFREITKRIPDKLQNRYSQQKSFDWYRDRWKESQIEKQYKKRFKKNKEAEFFRLDYSEVYKPTGINESFRGIVTDKERNQKYIEFYDLQIKNHPSYFANDFMVHNCHKLTADAQEAMLKTLEQCPQSVFIFLCTTEPDKLKITLKRRCLHFDLKPIEDDVLLLHLKKIAKKEKRKIPSTVLEKIIDHSMGSPGIALSILEKIMDLPKKLMSQEAEKVAAEKNAAIDLCRAIFNKAKWTKITTIIKGLKNANENPETIRISVFRYCGAILLKQNSEAAFTVMSAFKEPFYDSPWEKLLLACYECWYE